MRWPCRFGLLLGLFFHCANLAAQVSDIATKAGDRTAVLLDRPGSDRRAGEVRDAIVSNMERSYITFGAGAHFGGDQTGRGMLYEGQIFQNLNWFSGERFWIDIPVRFVVRQLTDESKPVRTPTFNPGLRLYWWPGPGDTPDKGTTVHYWSLGLHHYSNGQDGPSTNPDGTVNTRTGSFSTNYSELAWHQVANFGVFQWGRLAWRHHFAFTWEPFQSGQYETDNLSLTLRSKAFDIFGAASQITLTAGYSASGRDYVVRNEVDPTRDVKAGWRDNFSQTVELTVLPTICGRRWKDIALYLRYDHGYDYYNINFQHPISRLQFGFASANF